MGDVTDVSTYGKIIRFNETSRFESLCRYSEIQVSQSISESENGKRHALSRKRSVVLNMWQQSQVLGRRWELREKGEKQKLFLILSPRPGPDGPNASGWYRRLREPISPLSLLNCDQL